ncbi:MAG: hypothetical protein WB902_33445 [Acetobacteraceae bacterium]
MPTIASMNGATADRVVRVPDRALSLLNRCGLKPPQTGTMDMTEINTAMTSANLSTSERLAVKITLGRVGLIQSGTAIRDTMV